jgi:hypothetical protein
MLTLKNCNTLVWKIYRLDRGSKIIDCCFLMRDKTLLGCMIHGIWEIKNGLKRGQHRIFQTTMASTGKNILHGPESLHRGINSFDEQSRFR